MISTKNETPSLIFLEAIQNIKVVVTEEINQKNLNNFLITQCKLHNIQLTSNLFICPIFHKNLMEYDIYYFYGDRSSITVLWSILQIKQTEIIQNPAILYQINEGALSFYVLFHNGAFHSLHQAESSMPSFLILESLQQKYTLTSIATQTFVPNTIQPQSIIPDILFFKIYKNSFYKFYFVYLALLMIFFGFYEVQKYQIAPTNSIQTHHFASSTTLHQRLFFLTQFLESNQLAILQINYQNNELHFNGKLEKIEDLKKLHHPKIELLSSTIEQTTQPAITYKAKFHP